jgi:hypothetical protein
MSESNLKEQNQEAKGTWRITDIPSCKTNPIWIGHDNCMSVAAVYGENYAQQIINALNAKSEWIRVEDRLPEKDGRYEVVTSCRADKERVDCEYFYAHPDLKIWSGHFEVIAWRELPTPPKDL